MTVSVPGYKTMPGVVVRFGFAVGFITTASLVVLVCFPLLA